MRKFVKYIIIGFVYFTIVTSCKISNKSTFNFYSNDYFGIDTMSLKEYRKQQTKITYENIDTTKKYITANDILKLPLINGGNVILTDSLKGTDNPEIRENEYLGFLRDLNCYLVLIRYYESATYLLINKSNGIKYPIIDYPIISPNKKYFVSTSEYLHYDVMPTGIEMWMISKFRIKKLFSVLFENFQIEEAKWLNNNELIVKIGLENGNNVYGKLYIKK